MNSFIRKLDTFLRLEVEKVEKKDPVLVTFTLNPTNMKVMKFMYFTETGINFLEK